jgi:hypothetical protein
LKFVEIHKKTLSRITDRQIVSHTTIELADKEYARSKKIKTMAEIETVGFREPIDEALEVVSRWLCLYYESPTLPCGPPQNGIPNFTRSGIPYVLQQTGQLPEQGPIIFLVAIKDAFSSLPLHVKERKALLALMYHLREMLCSGQLEHTYDADRNGLVPMGPLYGGRILVLQYARKAIALSAPSV